MNWDEMAVVGRIARAHGIRGQVIVNLETDFPETRFRPGAELFTQRGGVVNAMRLTTVRFHRDRPRDTQALMLPTGQAQGVIMQAVLSLLPQRGSFQAALNDLVESCFTPDTENARTIGYIFIDRFGKRVRLLKDHTNPFAQFGHIQARVEDF